MDKVRYTSLKFKVWENKFYKLEKQREHIHLDDIKMEMKKKNTLKDVRLDDIID
jgi:hypothetical protein